MVPIGSEELIPAADGGGGCLFCFLYIQDRTDSILLNGTAKDDRTFGKVEEPVRAGSEISD